ncbi:MAG TPA: alpha/beta fold hydrolase [Phycisphaerae bacterium]|nr:alpha/beta fold hydrolase [Phycisphaerae bacterium]
MNGRWMRAGLGAALAVLIVAAATTGDDGAKDRRARALWQLMVDKKFAEFAAAGDDKMRAVLTADACKSLWDRLEFQLGRHQAIEGSRSSVSPPWHAVSMTCRHERGEAVIRIVLDSEDRLSGLWIDKIEPRDDPNAPVAPYVSKESFAEREVVASRASAGIELKGTLTLPRRDRRVPGVVLVHGSGPHDRDETIGPNKPFRDLAWGLASRGVAVLRYEKRTKAYPNFKQADEWTLDDETIDDALAAARTLREAPEVDGRRVFVVGHSLGAMAAPLIAQRDAKLAGIVLLAGSPRSIVDLLEEQVTYIASFDGVVTDEEREQLNTIRALVAAVRSGDLAAAPADVGLSARYLARMHALDVLGAARTLKRPVLICHGGRDYQVSKKDFELWRDGLSGLDHVTFELFDDLNHLFMEGRGPSSPEEYGRPGHVSVALIERLAGWVLAQKAAEP